MARILIACEESQATTKAYCDYSESISGVKYPYPKYMVIPPCQEK